MAGGTWLTPLLTASTHALLITLLMILLITGSETAQCVTSGGILHVAIGEECDLSGTHNFTSVTVSGTVTVTNPLYISSDVIYITKTGVLTADGRGRPAGQGQGAGVTRNGGSSGGKYT